MDNSPRHFTQMAQVLTCCHHQFSSSFLCVYIYIYSFFSELFESKLPLCPLISCYVSPKEKGVLLHNQSPVIKSENLIWLPAASLPALLVFPGMCFTELPPGTGPRSGPHAHPSLVSISRTTAGSCLVFHHAYSSYRDGAVSPEGRPHWVCLVFLCAQIRDMQVGQDPTHMTPPATLPSFTSADECCPPASLQVMPTWITSLVFSTISTAWRQCFPYSQRSTLRPHTCPDPHQPLPTPFRIH